MSLDNNIAKSQKPLTIGIDARITAFSKAGGVGSMIIALIKALGALTDGDEQYIIFTYDFNRELLTPYLGSNTKLETIPPTIKMHLVEWIKAAFPSLKRLARKMRSMDLIKISLAQSDGTIERLGVDVMHFPAQEAFLTKIPSIYQPHDLQHIHLPQYFDKGDIRIRELFYRTFCAQVARVVVASSWVKEDLIQHFNLPAEKISVIPLAPPCEGQSLIIDHHELEKILSKHGLTKPFIYYPAATWQHKNHIQLLEALALLRDKHGVVVPFVSSGHRWESFFPKIWKKVQDLRLEEQVRFLGFVTPKELIALYQQSVMTVIPSKFEAGSFPMWEAFQVGSPVASSNITSLPAQAAGAALIFDPDDPSDMADKIYRLWTDPSLRKNLSDKGRVRVAQFTWERTARQFRALYREVAGRHLTDEEQSILYAEPLL